MSTNVRLFITGPDADFLHLLDSLGNVIGWIDVNGNLGGTLGITSAAPQYKAQLVLQGKGDKDYYQSLDAHDVRHTVIDLNGTLNPTATPTQRGVYVVTLPAAKPVIGELTGTPAAHSLTCKDATGVIVFQAA